MNRLTKSVLIGLLYAATAGVVQAEPPTVDFIDCSGTRTAAMVLWSPPRPESSPDVWNLVINVGAVVADGVPVVRITAGSKTITGGQLIPNELGNITLNAPAIASALRVQVYGPSINAPVPALWSIRAAEPTTKYWIISDCNVAGNLGAPSGTYSVGVPAVECAEISSLTVTGNVIGDIIVSRSGNANFTPQIGSIAIAGDLLGAIRNPLGRIRNLTVGGSINAGNVAGVDAVLTRGGIGNLSASAVDGNIRANVGAFQTTPILGVVNSVQVGTLRGRLLATQANTATPPGNTPNITIGSMNDLFVLTGIAPPSGPRTTFGELNIPLTISSVTGVGYSGANDKSIKIAGRLNAPLSVGLAAGSAVIINSQDAPNPLGPNAQITVTTAGGTTVLSPLPYYQNGVAELRDSIVGIAPYSLWRNGCDPRPRLVNQVEVPGPISYSGFLSASNAATVRIRHYGPVRKRSNETADPLVVLYDPGSGALLEDHSNRFIQTIVDRDVVLSPRSTTIPTQTPLQGTYVVRPRFIGNSSDTVLVNAGVDATNSSIVGWSDFRFRFACGGGGTINPADVVDASGNPPGDNTVDGDDFIAFINSFAIGDVTVNSIADVVGGDGPNATGPDGTIDGSDFIAFMNGFAEGC